MVQFIYAFEMYHVNLTLLTLNFMNCRSTLTSTRIKIRP